MGGCIRTSSNEPEKNEKPRSQDMQNYHHKDRDKKLYTNTTVSVRNESDTLTIFYDIYSYNITVLGAVGVGKSALIYRLVANDYNEYYLDPTLEDDFTIDIRWSNETQMIKILDTAFMADNETEYKCLYPTLHRHWWQDTNAFMLVYDIGSFESFRYIKKFFDCLLLSGMERSYNEKPTNIVLVGNKCDLRGKLSPYIPLTKIEYLVFGYMRQFEQKSSKKKRSSKWRKNNTKIVIVPDEIKKICQLYYGSKTNSKIVTREMGEELAKSWERKCFRIPFFETSAKDNINVTEAFESFLILSQHAKDYQT